MNRTHEAAFETVIEAHLLQNGYARIAREGFDRERAIFPETVLAFIRETQPKEWTKLEALHGACAMGSSATGGRSTRGVLQGRARIESRAGSPL